ncbi:hypothetical protein N7532_002293 [Penicillium argentinense]|uniref:RING-type E3 ubiquitin transferase n=1 Tax=Penicillium argentinense TaxID=1131581 RepID=A0A9W9KLC8_9EURO|nr:uncharacterized protein N7532_002293 [Penicillium argentinense]KAJ5109648.1 hypothetical protein N7532_002293 [Penicillium argentinense]
MSLPSTASSSEAETSSAPEQADLRANTERRANNDRAETAAAQIILDSDDDDSLEPPGVFRSHFGQAAGRDTVSRQTLPHRGLPAVRAPRSSGGLSVRTGATYETAIDITSSSPEFDDDVNDAREHHDVPRSPASLSRRHSQRSSYVGDEYPVPRRPPFSASALDADRAERYWPSDLGRSNSSSSGRRHLSLGERGGYRFPDVDTSNEGRGVIMDGEPQPHRRPSSIFMPYHSHETVDDLQNMQRSPVTTRRVPGEHTLRYSMGAPGPPRHPSFEIHDPAVQTRSFSSRHSMGESSSFSRHGSHQLYSSMSMPRWHAGTDELNRTRRDRVSLPAPGETSQSRTLDEIFPEVNLPRWQPDSEVSSCPICGTVFSFWHRKHHCRKCGRVVCASCSPHRITIPRQYIVRPPESSDTPPPGLSPSSSSNVVDLTTDDTVTSNPVMNPALGGGEEVRLCNPCVPDPNPNPLGYESIRPHGHRSTHSLSSTIGSMWTVSRQSIRSPLSILTNTSNSLKRVAQDRAAVPWVPMTDLLPSAKRRYEVLLIKHRLETPINPGANTPHLTHHDKSSARLQYPNEICVQFAAIDSPLTDEYPVESREAHIRQCIEGYGAGRGSPASQSQGEGSARQALPSPPIARMLQFTATEKDCLGEDGAVAECTICMEDYEVGQVLARLECLCKFHKDCIIDWFERKAECPVHKVS